MGAILGIGGVIFIIIGLRELHEARQVLTDEGWTLLTKDTNWIVWVTAIITLSLMEILNKDSLYPLQPVGWLFVAAFSVALGMAAKGWAIRSRFQEMKYQIAKSKIADDRADIFKVMEQYRQTTPPAPTSTLSPEAPAAPMQYDEFSFDPARFIDDGQHFQPQASPPKPVAKAPYTVLSTAKGGGMVCTTYAADGSIISQDIDDQFPNYDENNLPRNAFDEDPDQSISGPRDLNRVITTPPSVAKKRK